MTVPYFPAVRDDELLYSVLARQRRHLGLPGQGAAMMSFFGRRSGIACYDLPGHMSALAARLDPAMGWTADRLVDRTTLFPYYAATMPAVSAAALRAAMLAGARDIHLAVGIAAFRVPRHRTLRFCRNCFRSMEQAHGEAYWLRSHQLPGSLVCPRHRRPLQESLLLLDGNNRHRFIVADVVSCPHDAPCVLPPVSRNAMRRLADIATANERLLEPTDVHRGSATPSAYRARLASVGLMRSTAKVDQVGLDAGLAGFYGDALAHLPGILRAGSCGDWLPGMSRSKAKAHHPLCHVLLDGFLASRSTCPSPFGNGPWPCRNPLEAHCGEPTIGTMREHRNRKTRVGTFGCGCGYVYTRCLFPDGRLGPPRLRDYGPTLAPALRRLIVPGAGLRAVAREVGLDPKTLMREAASLELATPWRCRASGAPKRQPVDRKMRASPKRAGRPHAAAASRKDWTAIDLLLATEVRAHASDITKLDPAVRVTVAELESRLGRCGWLRKRKDLLPLSNAAADDAAEDVQAFQRRRVFAVVRRLRDAGGYPAAWEVMRASGLSGHALPMIRAVMADAARSDDGRSPITQDANYG